MRGIFSAIFCDAKKEETTTIRRISSYSSTRSYKFTEQNQLNILILSEKKKEKETENSDISVTSFFVQTLLRNLQLQEIQLKEVVKQKKHVDQNSQFRQREKKQFWSSSLNRLLISSDAYLAKIVSEKRLTLITAWEESEKARAENR